MTLSFKQIGAVVALLIAGCSQATSAGTITPAPTGQLTPYSTITTTPMPPTSTPILSIPTTPAPTATPFLHTITNDDTMLGIAYKYGVSLEELQAANPGVDSHYLTVGNKLVIPIKVEQQEATTTPTLVPLLLTLPHCYRSGDGGAWCLASVKNNTEVDAENISAWFGLYTPAGENIANQTAYAPLNLLRVGYEVPLMSYFPPPLPDHFSVQAKLASVLEAGNLEGRYLSIQLISKGVSISADGRQATVSGEIVQEDASSVPSQIWILGIAYDTSGNIIGARKWETAGETQFEFDLYCLGGRIDHVEVLAEARP